MAQQYKLGTTATAVFTDDDGMTVIVYHSTPVVKFGTETIKLNNGGYLTATTKTRMNQASNQFDLGYSVTQKDGEWFVNLGSSIKPINGETTVKFDGETITLERNF